MKRVNVKIKLIVETNMHMRCWNMHSW